LIKDFNIIYAGNTFIFAFIFLLNVYYVDNQFLSLSILSLYYLNFLFSLERAILVNSFVPLFFNYSFILKNRIIFLKSFFWGFLIFLFLLINIKSILNLFGIDSIRFDLTPESIFLFIKTIWDSNIEMDDGGAIGTRTHRISMWFEVLNNSLKNVKIFFLGNGYDGLIVENDFNGIPHNGFISIVYRSGYVGLILFIYILYTISRILFRYKYNNLRLFYFIFTILFSFILEILTGTIIDSPFTSLLAYQIISLLLVILIQKKSNIPRNEHFDFAQ
jgi:hypothetical protein